MAETNTVGPPIDVVTVIRHRMQASTKGDSYEESHKFTIWCNVNDPDLILATLERSKWRIGNGNYVVERDMQIKGLPEPEPDDDE